MNKEHTPEPWGYIPQKTGNNQYILVTQKTTGSYRYIGYINDINDAKRIVPCINAMEGIEDPEQWMKATKEAIDAARHMDISFPNKMDCIKENWTKPENDCIDVPDCLVPLFNSVGMQIRFYRLSGKNEMLTVADIVETSRQFFKNNPETLK